MKYQTTTTNSSEPIDWTKVPVYNTDNEIEERPCLFDQFKDSKEPKVLGLSCPCPKCSPSSIC